MRTVRLSWPAMAIVLLVLLACLGALVDADPTQTEAPGEGYSQEDRERLYARLRKIYNKATRQRYGKRYIPETVLSKQLFPDSQDTSVKSRPEGTYKW